MSGDGNAHGPGAHDPGAGDPGTGQRKIFPRNLTARAAHVVRGNPASARPESGVDNAHPGLEFDTRRLDRAFFPGLVFDFQFLGGARLVEALPGIVAPDDLAAGLWLWYLFGRFGADPATPRLVELYGRDGYDALRSVRDLEPGPLLVVVGPTPDGMGAPALPALLQAAPLFGQLRAGQFPEAGLVLRGPDGRLCLAALLGERAALLDREGVIAPAALPPGALTESLCAPWQWDFADCGCHYWASNKPDIVIAPEGEANFQRDRKAAQAPENPRAHASWTGVQMTQQAMIARWGELPFVIAETETDRAAAPPPPAVLSAPFGLDAIADELAYLATVEHALAVEYLYARYSLNAPTRLPPGAGARETRLYQASQEILTIAIDEMRHLRWANEALALLGHPVSLGRAKRIGRHGWTVQRDFALRPLTRDQLGFFIAVEAPSRHVGARPDSGDLDGMYTRILLSLDAMRPPALDAARLHRLREVVKLIIDEGDGHAERLRVVERTLDGLDEREYLRLGKPAAAGDPVGAALQAVADGHYASVLSVMAEAFRPPLALRGEMLRQARRAMHNLDEAAQEMAERGVTPLFRLPAEAPDAPARLSEASQVLRGSADERLRRFAARHVAPDGTMLPGADAREARAGS